MSRKTPESARAEQIFVEKAMQLVMSKLYPGVSESVFRREWQDLLLAISEPADYVKMRGWDGSAGLYMKILRKACEDLASKGDSVIRSRNKPNMLRAWLQQHLKFQGDTYLEEIKSAAQKATTAHAQAILRGLKPIAKVDEAAAITDTLIAARDLIKAPKRFTR